MTYKLDTKSILAAVGLFGLTAYNVSVGLYSEAITSLMAGLAVLGLTYKQQTDHEATLLKLSQVEETQLQMTQPVEPPVIVKPVVGFRPAQSK